MSTQYRYVLSTPMGEFFSEPRNDHMEPRDVWIALGVAGHMLHRIESNNGWGWVTV